MKNKPYTGMWDFFGSCAPLENEDGTYETKHMNFDTFSLGCFQWVEKSGGKGLKKGNVQFRVVGKTHNPKQAFEDARAYCQDKNGGY